MTTKTEWRPIETAPRRGIIAGLTYSGKVIIGRIPNARGKVRDPNTIENRYTGMRHPCTHWSPVENVAREGAPKVFVPLASKRPA
jgi:hypothetical protein